MKKRNEFIIILINILIIIITVKTNIFGSTMDFLNQHIVFPEYLRNTFYETGKIIPSMITIGGIENIYNIAYYGLLNPIILISYLLPFIKMIDYIVISNIILLISSDILFYKFVKDKFNKYTVFIVTLLFMLSGPLIFQFHRHFMFVNYMPFLILSLINIDKDKKINLIIDIFLIIMISFYYSIPSIITIILYSLYKNKKNLLIIPIPILMSGILIIPTLYSIISTRTPGNIDLTNLIPYINIDNLLYGGYSPGLSSILIISMIYLLQTKRKNNIFLVISISILSFVPIVTSLLNGGLYPRPKILIPLLPLLVYIIGIFIDNIDNIDIKKLLKLIIIINIIILIRYHVLVYYIDLISTIIIILIYNKTKIKHILLPIVLLNLVLCIGINKDEDYITKKLYNDINKDKIINTTYRTTNLNNNNYTVNKYNFTPNIYSSTINKYYSNLYHNIFKINNDTINNLELTSTKNILFNEYLGVRYVVSDNELLYPYKKISNNLYELEQALPLGYINKKTVNKEYYESLVYPYNLDILMNYVIDENSKNKPTSNIKKIDYKIDKNSITVEDKYNTTLDIGDQKEKILFININNQIEQDFDISITINNEKNILTKKDWLYSTHNNNFHYVLEGTDKLNIEFTKGIYNLSDIEVYTLDNSYIKGINKTIDKFDIIKMNSEKILGNISTDGGYFILSIPYDKGFKIKVNGEYKDYKLMNESFIGLYLDKGNYDIEITYDIPYLKAGIITSIIGFILLIGECIYEKNSNTNNTINTYINSICKHSK